MPDINRTHKGIQTASDARVSDRTRSQEENYILEQIEETEQTLRDLRRRLVLEERISDLKEKADALRYSV